MTDFFRKRRVGKQLGKLIKPEAVEEILSKGELTISPIQSGRIEFIFVIVRAESPQQLSERLGLVADVAREHHAMVFNAVGPMMNMAFGTHGSCAPSSRTTLVTCLHEQLRQEVKIVHGVADGHFGNFGNNRWINYSFTFPRFGEALTALGNLEFGQIKEFTA